MAPPSAQAKPGSVTLRVLSAAVMLPAAIGAAWLGGWVFAALVALAAGLMYWEWQGLCGEKGRKAQGLAALCGLTTFLWGWAGPWTTIVAGVCVGVVGGTAPATYRLFLLSGFAYVCLACVSLVWLRGYDAAGLETVLWLGAVVVATDTAAYFTGRTLGGPKLAPKISPKKTWSGLLGGMAGAAAAGGAVAVAVDGADVATLGLLGGAFAVIAQLGDLLVSKAKRTFSVKDSSNLIPGHGGVLDRLDGFLSTSLVLAALVLLSGGSPVAWQ